MNLIPFIFLPFIIILILIPYWIYIYESNNIDNKDGEENNQV